MRVIKTHSTEHIEKEVKAIASKNNVTKDISHMRVFVSEHGSGLEDFATRLDSYWPGIIAQRRSTVELSRKGGVAHTTNCRNGHRVRASVGLSDTQMAEIHEFFRYWDFSGRAADNKWRNELYPRQSYTNHHSDHSPTTPACDMYDIAHVERYFINATLYRRWADNPDMKKSWDIFCRPRAQTPCTTGRTAPATTMR